MELVQSETPYLISFLWLHATQSETPMNMNCNRVVSNLWLTNSWRMVGCIHTCSIMGTSTSLPPVSLSGWSTTCVYVGTLTNREKRWEAEIAMPRIEQKLHTYLETLIHSETDIYKIQCIEKEIYKLSNSMIFYLYTLLLTLLPQSYLAYNEVFIGWNTLILIVLKPSLGAQKLH